VNYFNEPFTEPKLRELIAKTGMRPFEILRSKEGVTTETPDQEIISMIVRDPNLLQRPIVEVGDKAVMARPIEKALKLLGNPN
jgi:arsenate reductase (glutaredoxin)